MTGTRMNEVRNIVHSLKAGALLSISDLLTKLPTQRKLSHHRHKPSAHVAIRGALKTYLMLLFCGCNPTVKDRQGRHPKAEQCAFPIACICAVPSSAVVDIMNCISVILLVMCELPASLVSFTAVTSYEASAATLQPLGPRVLGKVGLTIKHCCQLWATLMQHRTPASQHCPFRSSHELSL